jgi:hypothetical protein
MEENERGNEISSMAKLDFKILCETLGKEKTIEIFRIADALHKESKMEGAIGRPEPPSC